MSLYWKLLLANVEGTVLAFSGWRGWEGEQDPFYLLIPVDGVVTHLIFLSSLPWGIVLGYFLKLVVVFSRVSARC